MILRFDLASAGDCGDSPGDGAWDGAYVVLHRLPLVGLAVVPGADFAAHLGQPEGHEVPRAHVDQPAQARHAAQRIPGECKKLGYLLLLGTDAQDVSNAPQ